MTMLPSAMDPKAAKRFENNRVQAAQANTLGQAGKAAFHTNVNRSNGRLQQLMAPTQNVGGQPSINQGSTVDSSVPPEAMQMQMQQPDPAETIKNNLDLEYFLSSPAVQQQISRSRLRKYFIRNSSGVDIDVASDALSNLLQGT